MTNYRKSLVRQLNSEIIDLREALDSMLIESVECIRLEDMSIELRDAIQVGNSLVRFSALLLRYSEVKYLICSTTR